MFTFALAAVHGMAYNRIMAKKKKQSGGPHKTPRSAVQIPADWWALARKLAAMRAQPAMWLLLTLLADAAEKAGEPRPRFPWEDGRLLT